MTKLIVFEGLDRAGKTIQSEKLAKRLDAKLLRFPDRSTTIGQMIDSYLKSSSHLPDEAIHLLFSANRWELAEKIRESLKTSNVIIDRYVYSGVAFTAAKGLDAEWCAAPDKGLPEPDLVIFLDVSTEAAESRGGYGNERYERKEFQLKVREQFLRLKTDKWAWISADNSIESVEQEILTHI